MMQALPSTDPTVKHGPGLLAPFLCVALAAVFAALQISHWPVNLRYPGEFEITEGIVLAEMTQLREGEPVYAPATPERFCSMIYGPLYYLLGSRLIDPHAPAYNPLRILSMFATLGLAGASGLLAWWATKSRAATVLSPLIFLAYRFITRFAVSARPDTLALLFWFAGFLVAFRFRDSNKILWSIPLMTLGAYYKQQFIVGPLAVFLFLVLEKRFRTALQFAALLGAAGLSLLAVFEFVVFRHQAFALHILTYNVLPFSLREGFLRLLGAAIVFSIPCIMAFLYLRSHPNKLLACYLGWAIVLLPLMISRKGAGLNYALELFLIVCPLAAGYLTTGTKAPDLAAVVICLFALALWLGRIEWGNKYDPTPRSLAADQAVQTFLRQTVPPRTPALGYFTGDLLRAGLDTPITNFFQYSWLVCKGELKDDSLVAQIRQRRFGVILLTQDLTNETEAHNPVKLCLTEPVHQAILQNYRMVRTFDFELWDRQPYYAWEPR